MISIRDAVWLCVAGALGCLWYGDRTILSQDLRAARIQFQGERRENAILEDLLKARNKKPVQAAGAG
jgi:hypothetical protein